MTATTGTISTPGTLVPAGWIAERWTIDSAGSWAALAVVGAGPLTNVLDMAIAG